MPTTINRFIAGEELVFDHDRALWWPGRRILMIADLHYGKLGHFQRFGIPLPDTETETDLARLDCLIGRYDPERLIILGDMFHSDANAAWERLMSWRRIHVKISIELVLGNHDRWLGRETIAAGGFIVHADPLELGPFLLSHEPAATDRYNLCGHLHPCTTLVARGKTSFRLPVFWIGAGRLVLPAFGRFTGMHRAKPDAGDQLVAVADDRLIEV